MTIDTLWAIVQEDILHNETWEKIGSKGFLQAWHETIKNTDDFDTSEDEGVDQLLKFVTE